MAVFRIEKNKDYTVMSNHHLRDRGLSLKAKGLLSLMLSLPNEWDFSLIGLAHICQDGISSVRSGINELERNGYVTRRRLREPNGQLGDTEYTIHEVPQPPDDEGNPPPMCDKPTLEKPTCDFLTQDNPTYDNHTQLNISTNQIRNQLNPDLSNIHQSICNGADAPDAIDAIDAYREILKDNIGYEALCHAHSRDELTEILELMLETLCSAKKTIRIGGENKPAEIVKRRMLELDQFHIEYVLETLGKNTTAVRNIKSYMLTALYNAPVTIGNYYQQLVNHDFNKSGGN
jgi:hypothetical protein